MSADSSEMRLTIGAVFCRCLMWFPFWMLMLSVLNGGAAKLLPCSGILLASAFLTGLWARHWKLRLHAYPVRALAAVCLLLIPLLFAVPWLLWRMTGGILTVLLPSAATLIFIAWTADSAPDMLFSVRIYTAFLTLAVLSVILLFAAQISVPMTLLSAVICVESGGFFLLRNQFMLRRMVNRRSTEETEVPAEIRRGNLMFSAGIFAFLLLVVLCRVPLLHLLQWMQDAAVWLIAMLLRGFTRLIAVLGGNAPESATEIPADPGEDLITAAGSGSPLWGLLWIPLLFITFVVWRAFLSEWVYDIREAISAMMQRLRGDRQADNARITAQNAEYTDTETREKPQQSARRMRRDWKKKLRIWRRMDATGEKFYAGYLLLLEAPAWRGDQPQDADTVQEICAHWQCLYGTELNAVTDAFERNRYAEMPLPASALADMERALERAAIS